MASENNVSEIQELNAILLQENLTAVVLTTVMYQPLQNNASHTEHLVNIGEYTNTTDMFILNSSEVVMKSLIPSLLHTSSIASDKSYTKTSCNQANLWCIYKVHPLASLLGYNGWEWCRTPLSSDLTHAPGICSTYYVYTIHNLTYYILLSLETTSLGPQLYQLLIVRGLNYQ